MFKYYFEQVHNVEIWPIISLIIFFVFFIGLIAYVWKMRKDYVEHMQELPLADGAETEIESPKKSLQL
ncbi:MULTISPECIES: cytochrome C oxidase Cbb3 [Roseivirga]|jgi:cytochrome c oxidase cbb3-type subunit 3|uniref:cytochrome C oxidase Cbb3 n=1 Tax=Roseivirga TaxID=290180 RepID=UPI0025810C2C|nr:MULTISPECIES: cytochrome C oxidase Cbb3 [Roseivirga]MEC7754893.1 cytochrome C oxidase Cbb3 [Bacteroidota bacterium]|tara:strand:+ start:16041 stop:16244 length:204 start_codon:yes stop_codon:yes gene_type:complete